MFSFYYDFGNHKSYVDCALVPFGPTWLLIGGSTWKVFMSIVRGVNSGLACHHFFPRLSVASEDGRTEEVWFVLCWLCVAHQNDTG
mmetsp:Transcript_25822/g.61316  ORF Transcript_25822/g.61316 Transcript_25822/m.61316 type:complete len:86 (-) Transcript_25822:2180-2437(-)